jgi:hypothetical protein
MVAPKHLTDTPPGAVELDHAAIGEHTANTSIAEVGDVVATASVASGEPPKTLSSRVRRIVRYRLVGPAQPMMGNSLAAETTRGSSFQRKEFDGPDQGVQDR